MSDYLYTGTEADALKQGAVLLRKEADKITADIRKLEDERGVLLMRERALTDLWRKTREPQ